MACAFLKYIFHKNLVHEDSRELRWFFNSSDTNLEILVEFQVLDALGEKLPCAKYDSWMVYIPEGEFLSRIGPTEFFKVNSSFKPLHCSNHCEHFVRCILWILSMVEDIETCIQNPGNEALCL